MEIQPIVSLVPNDVEQALLDRVVAGDVLDLEGGAVADRPIDATTIRSWKSWRPERTIRATIIRNILLGRLAADPDPHGVRLRGARIEGTLDLENLTSTIPIELTECLLTDGVIARSANLPAVTLRRCWLEHPSQPPLIADRLTTPLLVLARSNVAAHCEVGGVCLEGGHLGQFKADGAILDNDKGPALYADWLSVDRDAFLIRASVTGTGPKGAVRVIGVHIGGQLDFAGARFTNKTGPALVADNLRVDNSVHLRGGFTATGAGKLGTVRLSGAHIGGQLNFEGARFTNETGPALVADYLRLDQSLLAASQIVRNFFGLPEQVGFTATGAGEFGVVRLLGANIGGRLDFEGARFTNKTGPALVADNLRVDNSVYLRGEFTATGASELGTVRLPGAYIGGQLNFAGATLTNETGPALAADGLKVDQSLFAGSLIVDQPLGFGERVEFTATGAGELGTVRLSGAHIGGQLNFEGARLTNETGPALSAESLRVDQSLFIRSQIVSDFLGLPEQVGFTATGASGLGTVRLVGAYIGGYLDFRGARLTNETGPALAADNLKVDQGVYLRGEFTATGAGELGAVRLSGAHIGGQLNFAVARLTNETGPALDARNLTVGSDLIFTGQFAARGNADGVVLDLGMVQVGGAFFFFHRDRVTHATCPNALVDVDGLTYVGLPREPTTREADVTFSAADPESAASADPESAASADPESAASADPESAASADPESAASADPESAASADPESAASADPESAASADPESAASADPESAASADPESAASADPESAASADPESAASADQWLRLIREGTRTYAAQPYQYFATALRAAGNDRGARDTLIAQRRDQIGKKDLIGWRERAWTRFIGVMIGYGYKPSRALFYLLSIVIISVVLSVTLGAHGGLTQSKPPAGKHAAQCTGLQQVAVGLDLGTPLLSINAVCDTTTSATGDGLTIAGWTLRVLEAYSLLACHSRCRRSGTWG